MFKDNNTSGPASKHESGISNIDHPEAPIMGRAKRTSTSEESISAQITRRAIQNAYDGQR